MDGDTEDFPIQWDEDIKQEIRSPQRVQDLDHMQTGSYSMATGAIKNEIDQMAAENLMFLSQDVVSFTESAELDDPNVECVTEEVITEDWVIPDGQERVEIHLEQLAIPVSDAQGENELDVPLPTDQDEYTAMRPWPCDFCSRRFRKKAALMNHMVAHQNDRPHACNLCGVRYVRKCDLMNHLKVHAFVPDNSDTVDYDDLLQPSTQIIKPKKRGRRRKNPEPVENGLWENMTSARTQQWSRRARTSPKRNLSPPLPPSPPTPPSPAPPPADPSRPFVCKHCGVGFAREKALQSHSRVHGGDSPVECNVCGELCWSREALASHTRRHHPQMPPQPRQREPSYNGSSSVGSGDDDDMDYNLSPSTESASVSSVERIDRGSERSERAVRAPQMFCPDCGVAFQRADLLRRHVAAAHSHKRHDSSSSTWADHTCEVCGESFTDALQLLAHAELHAERHRAPGPRRLKKVSHGRNNTSSCSSMRQFPCKECGKVFGSRSSQQIHVRIHTGERPYGCRFCWKAFADGGTLRKHERIHTGEKPYACAVCPRAFNQRVVLREHVRSHHSAPDRRANGGPAYTCAVCGVALHSSGELVQHLIEHCDANTALKRQPQTGPRKYKRRRKLKETSPQWSASPPRSPAPSSPPRRRRRLLTPPQRPRMIHIEEPKKQVRTRRPPRHPADDLRAIRLHSPAPSPSRSPPAPSSPAPASPELPPSPNGPYKCEICDMEFPRRDALLIHVPVHI